MKLDIPPGLPLGRNKLQSGGLVIATLENMRERDVTRFLLSLSPVVASFFKNDTSHDPPSPPSTKPPLIPRPNATVRGINVRRGHGWVWVAVFVAVGGVE